MHRSRRKPPRAVKYLAPLTLVVVLGLVVSMVVSGSAANADMPWHSGHGHDRAHRHHHFWPWSGGSSIGKPISATAAPTAGAGSPTAVPGPGATSTGTPTGSAPSSRAASTKSAGTATTASAGSASPGSASSSSGAATISAAGYSSTSGVGATFTSRIPALPAVASAGLLGAVNEGNRVGGRDAGDSAELNGKSYWAFADTTLKNPWGFVSNSAAVTTDLDAGDGISLQAGTAFSTIAAAPQTLIPHTPAETAFENAHNPSRTGCTAKTDQYCGAVFGYWPGDVVADPAHDRVLVFFGKICRMGGTGTPCSGPWKGLGNGIAAINLKTHTVTRLPVTGRTVAQSVEGADPTMTWTASQANWSGDLVVHGILYTRGQCDYWHCATARVPLSQVTDLAAYRYWDGSAWVSDPSRAVKTAAAGGTTFYDAALKLWMNVSLPYGNQTVIYQVAGQPWGPFSAAKTALTIPKGDGTNYSMYVHTEYAQDNGAVQFLTWFDQQSGDQKMARITFATR